MQWKKNGFDISHRAAISWNVLEDLRSEMSQALSVSGFRKSLLLASSNVDESGETLVEESEVAADNLLGFETGVSESNVSNSIPQSARWLATHFGRWRPSGRVRGKDEWEYFESNIINFQRGSGASDEADNYSSIQFSAFANHWNEWVASLGTNKPTVTYKSSSHLQDAHKIMQQRARNDSTLLPHARNIDNLRATHTNSSANQPFVANFVEAQNPTRRCPAVSFRSVCTQTDDDEIGDTPENALTPAELARSEGNGRNKRKGHNRPSKNARPRCRRCGKEWSLPEWKNKHTNKISDAADWNGRSQSRVLRHGEGNKVWDNCEVSSSEFSDGFPCLTGPMPKRKKAKTPETNNL